MKNARQNLTCAALAAWLLLPLQAVLARSPDIVSAGDIQQLQLSFTDPTRGTKATYDFKGTSDRRLDVQVWYPSRDASSESNSKPCLLPLVIYGHGTYGYASNNMHTVKYLVEHGYVVAAPTFPLTARDSFARLPAPDVSDTRSQTADISYLIGQLLQHPVTSQLIDAEKIGVTGHSLGAVTSYFLAYGTQTRDPRIKAISLIAGGDPVQSALSSDLGLQGVRYAPVSVPVLFLSASKDVFASLTGRPFAAYSRVEPPKFEVLINNGTHVWFRDGNDAMADGRNPDCHFFESWKVQVNLRGCAEPEALIDADVQKAIARDALLTFFNAYLRGDEQSLLRLQQLGQYYAEVTERFELN